MVRTNPLHIHQHNAAAAATNSREHREHQCAQVMIVFKSLECVRVTTTRTRRVCSTLMVSRYSRVACTSETTTICIIPCNCYTALNTGRDMAQTTVLTRVSQQQIRCMIVSLTLHNPPQNCAVWHGYWKHSWVVGAKRISTECWCFILIFSNRSCVRWIIQSHSSCIIAKPWV